MFSRIPRFRLLPLSGWFSVGAGATLFLSLSAVARAGGPTPPRDWSKNPAIVELDLPSDVVVYAVGDPHADYARLIDLLVKGDIIDEVGRQPDQLESVKWKAGNAVLVCTGDMIDKGTDSIEVLQLFMRLQKIAPEAGGMVVVTLGNHEAEFLGGPTDKNKEFVAELQQKNIDISQIRSGTDSLGLGQFMLSLPFAARINDWFFAHAGNTNSKNPDKATHPRSLEELRSFLETDVKANGYGGPSLSESDSLLEAKLDNPWWEKKGDTGQDSQNRLRKYVTALGTPSHRVQHLVIGHQPGKVDFNGDQPRKKGVMVNRYLGTIFLIDCGMSSAVNNSTGALLRIRRDDVYSIRFEGDVRKEELLMAQKALSSILRLPSLESRRLPRHKRVEIAAHRF
jgi:hypothetical protein